MELNKRISKSLKGRFTKEKNSFYGKTHSHNTKVFLSKINSGENNPAWKGGNYINGGYKVIYIEEGKHILEHRYIMEKYINRKLTSDEIVHHKDENKLNNSINNLKVMSQSEHKALHKILRKNM